MIGPFWLHLVSFAALLVPIRAVRRWAWLYALVVLPGTLAHELTHWLGGCLARSRFPCLSCRAGCLTGNWCWGACCSCVCAGGTRCP